MLITKYRSYLSNLFPNSVLLRKRKKRNGIENYTIVQFFCFPSQEVAIFRHHCSATQIPNTVPKRKKYLMG